MFPADLGKSALSRSSPLQPEFLAEKRESMADVSRRAGHAGIGVTVDTYGHRLGVSKSLAATMGGILSKAVGDPTTWLANG
jgi:hypothetical protein